MFEIKPETIAAKMLIKTHYLMKVVQFYPETQTVDLVQDTFGFSNTPFGNIQVANDFGQTCCAALTVPDSILGVPVKQLRWGQFEIQCCPKEGDTGYIEVFSDDIRDWMANGGPSVPWSNQHFIKESCVFVPFIPNKTNASSDYPEDNTTLVIKSANASITITDKPAEEGREENEAVVDIATTAKTIHINAENGITSVGDMDITGNINIKGDITSEGNISVTGDVSVDGNITAAGEVKSDKTVTGKEDVVGGGISLKSHTHPFTYSAGPSAGAMGNTNPPA